MGDEDLYCVIDSMIICKFTRTIWKVYDDIATVYSLVTGIPMTAEEMGQVGERISNLARVFNIREGLTRSDDSLPERIKTDPIPSGVAKGSITTQKDLDIMLDGYYEARGWTPMGVPTKAKLEELGLGSYADIIGIE